jgi:hypothetical protein
VEGRELDSLAVSMLNNSDYPVQEDHFFSWIGIPDAVICFRFNKGGCMNSHDEYHAGVDCR